MITCVGSRTPLYSSNEWLTMNTMTQNLKCEHFRVIVRDLPEKNLRKVNKNLEIATFARWNRSRKMLNCNKLHKVTRPRCVVMQSPTLCIQWEFARERLLIWIMTSFLRYIRNHQQKWPRDYVWIKHIKSVICMSSSQSKWYEYMTKKVNNYIQPHSTVLRHFPPNVPCPT